MNKLSKDQFIKRVEEKHPKKYDFSKVNYVDRETHIILICRNCSTEFLIAPRILYNKTLGFHCPTCKRAHIAKENIMTQEEFIIKAIKTHGNKYEYGNAKYKDCFSKIHIFCNKCNKQFLQKPKDHLSGSGCQNCKNIEVGKRFQLDKNHFIEEAKRIHKDNYSYENTIYVNSRKKVEIKCNICGDIFKIRPDSHIAGGRCLCDTESLGEKIIRNFLNDNNVKFERNKKFNGCKRIRSLRYDFYLKDINLLIEYDGRQHFEPFYIEGVSKGKAKEILKLQVESDFIKTEYAKNNRIELLRIKYTEMKSIGKILSNVIKLHKGNKV